MTPGLKILIGAVGTAALALGSHIAMGRGFIDQLTTKAQQELAGDQAPGVTVAFQSNPLARVAELSGPVKDEATRSEILGRIRALPGVADAHWVGGGDVAPAAAAPEKPATAAAVQNCQDGVDAVVKGQTIEFTSGDATLTPKGSALVASLAEKLKPCAGTQVEVRGYTDASGNPAFNQTLSERRAQTVRAALIALGVPEARLTAAGFGASHPIAEGRSAEADSKNRRIEFSVSASKAN